MKTFFLTIIFWSVSTIKALAHEGGKEVAGTAKAGWQGPAIAVLIIVISVAIARFMHKKTKVVDKEVISQ